MEERRPRLSTRGTVSNNVPTQEETQAHEQRHNQGNGSRKKYKHQCALRPPPQGVEGKKMRHCANQSPPPHGRRQGGKWKTSPPPQGWEERRKKKTDRCENQRWRAKSRGTVAPRCTHKICEETNAPVHSVRRKSGGRLPPPPAGRLERKTWHCGKESPGRR